MLLDAGRQLLRLDASHLQFLFQDGVALALEADAGHVVGFDVHLSNLALFAPDAVVVLTCPPESVPFAK